MNCVCGDESCDGTDGTGGGGGNGARDEAACGDDDDCSNWRTDPVHVGSGAFVTETQVDVRFAGAAVPIELARHYTSLDGWQNVLWNAGARVPSTRLAQGWFHSFDERLFAANAYSDAGAPVSGSEDLRLVHRLPNGRGRGFVCPPPHAPGSTFTCNAPDDGSVGSLRWNATLSQWEIADGRGVVTVFAASGRLSGKYDPAGDGWTVVYHSSGAEEGLIDYVVDHLGRQLRFVWDLPQVGVPARLVELRDSSSVTLATFEYGVAGLLSRATSAAGDESFVYVTTSDGGVTYYSPYLRQIVRDGSVVTDVTYEYKDFGAGVGWRCTGRVASIEAADGTFELRYASDANNLCGDATTSTIAS